MSAAKRGTKGCVEAVRLRVKFGLPTGRQQRALDDAMRILAIWAIRAARMGEEALNQAGIPPPSALTSGRGEVRNEDR